MKFEYLFFVLFSLPIIKDSIQAFRTKKWLDVVSLLMTLPFLFFFVTSCILGGSAGRDAATNYELYEAGHYYLVSHGTYTEVSYSQFKFMEVTEIIGLSSFAIAFILAIVKHVRKA